MTERLRGAVILAIVGCAVLAGVGVDHAVASGGRSEAPGMFAAIGFGAVMISQALMWGFEFVVGQDPARQENESAHAHTVD